MDRGTWQGTVCGVARVIHDLATTITKIHIGEGNGNPPQYSCLENPMDRGAWGATVHRVANSWTQLKRLSSSSSSAAFISLLLFSVSLSHLEVVPHVCAC